MNTEVNTIQYYVILNIINKTIVKCIKCTFKYLKI